MEAVVRKADDDVLAPGACPAGDDCQTTSITAVASSLAVPRRGHVLTTVAEEYGGPIREAVGILERSLRRGGGSAEIRSRLFARRLGEPGAEIVRPDSELLAWSLVSVWLTGFASRSIKTDGGLFEAMDWFFGESYTAEIRQVVSERAVRNAEKALALCETPDDYLDLLPYVLDPHGPGSRLSIRRDARTRSARDRKRSEGVYYTPADVAGHMVGECLSGQENAESAPVVFDPACGTAVFLRTALAEFNRLWPDFGVSALAVTRLYGTDIDPWALDAAAFVLLADCFAKDKKEASPPLALWHRLRLNFATVDALRLDPADANTRSGTTWDAVAGELDGGKLPALEDDYPFETRISLSDLFTGMPEASFVVVGNPPYAALGNRSDFTVLAERFETLAVKATATAEIFPLFVEQMVRLAPKGRAAGALVLPLSIASNIGGQFAAARALIEATPGTWRFSFFDREPHALFGEDVKTRNSIVIWHRQTKDRRAIIETGPLRKWRGDSRAAMLAAIRHTALNASIRSGIPKIDGDYQARAYETLAARWQRFDHVCSSIHRCPLAQALTSYEPSVFVGPTAYNFLNIFLKPTPGLLAAEPALSEHPLHAVTLRDHEDAAAVFALLSSHLAYWWWHANGDGFHITSRFLANLPFGSDALSESARPALTACGQKLWTLIQREPIISVNRGRTSLGFSPNGYDELRRDIDEILADLAGLDAAFVSELQQFTAHTIRAELRTISTHKDKKGGR